MNVNMTLKMEILKAYPSQFLFCDRHGLSERRVSGIIRGRLRGTPKERMRISDALGKSESYLFEGESGSIFFCGPCGDQMYKVKHFVDHGATTQTEYVCPGCAHIVFTVESGKAIQEEGASPWPTSDSTS